MLTEHGSLSEANIVLKTEIGSLEKEAVGLEEKVKLKGEIEAEIAALKAEKTSLEPYVSELHAKKDQLEKVQNYVDSLTKKRAELEKDTASMEKYKTALDKDIRVKEKKVSNLEKLEKRHDAVSASLAETKKKLDWEERRLKVLDSIQGVVKSSSVAQLEKFAENLPYYIEEVKGGHYSGEIIRNILVENLTGGTLQVLRCSSCEAKFVVDKQPSLPGSDYYCPVCGMSYYVNVDKNALAILKEELLELKKPNVVFIERISPGSQEQKNLDKADK
jgi:DNA repair exonuclease SbcCD ATPase subunit